MEQVLVLDVAYRPTARIPWQQAIVNVIVDRIAEVVEEYPDRYIRTPNWSVKMPSVIRLIKGTPRKRAIKFSRYNIWARDGGKCQYCGSRVSRDEYTYDHVVPRSQGGQTTWDNVVVACVPCNQRKGGRTPAQAHMVLRSVPVKPKRIPDMGGGMSYREGMPESWKNWLRDSIYWNSELEQGK